MKNIAAKKTAARDSTVVQALVTGNIVGAVVKGKDNLLTAVDKGTDVMFDAVDAVEGEVERLQGIEKEEGGSDD